jgi:Tol biopolymer transport system component
MSDVARQLRWLQAGLSAGKSGALNRAAIPTRSRSRVSALAIGIAVALATISAAAAWWLASRGRADQVRLHAFLLPPDGNYLTGGLALSPDGRTLAFVAADASGERQLWVRALDAARAQPVAGTNGATDVFFSPSGTEVAFFAGNQLKRVPVSGGAASVICEAGAGAGGSWNRDGVIIFQPHQQGNLMRVAAAGGRPEPATALDPNTAETHHLHPSFLPDGTHYVFYVAGKQRGLYVGELGSNQRTLLFDPDPSLPPGAAATPGVYASTGHLLYVRDRVLMARAFDASSRTLTGEPIKLADTVDYNPPGEAAFAVAGSVLVYRPRQHLPLASLAWLDRAGTLLSSIAVPPAAFQQIALSPDGRMAAVDRRDAQGVSSVWTINLQDGSSTRVPADYWSGQPIWSADGALLAYSIAADSPPNIVVRAGRGLAAEQRLTKSSDIQYSAAFTPDARTLIFRSFSSDTGWDLFTVPAAGGPAQRLLQTPANENEAGVSPDGRLIAYTSDESGRTEVYVSRFPEMSGRVAVSSGGGGRPQWRRDGRELYFVGTNGRISAVSIAPTASSATVSTPVPLFRASLSGGLYAASADGSRFLVATPAASTDIVPLELRLNALTPR